MKLLFVTPYLPHPYSGHGTGVFLYGLLQRLAERHEVTILSFIDDIESELDCKALSPRIRLVTLYRPKGKLSSPSAMIKLIVNRIFCICLSVIRWEPFYVSKWTSSPMASTIQSLTWKEKFDVVQFEFSFLGKYARNVLRGRKIVHAHDLVYRPTYRLFKQAKSLPLKFLYWIEWCRWANYEPKIVKAVDDTLTVTRQDQRLLQKLTKLDRSIHYFPRAIDSSSKPSNFQHRNKGLILFVGSFLHHPNVDAATWLVNNIFPRVRSICQQATLQIIGQHPPPSLVELSKNVIGVHTLGFVEDLESHFAMANVFVAPLRFGGGIKLKVLHAMAAGVPIVTTKVGAEGIEGLQRDSLLIGQTPDEIANHICSLINSEDLCRQVGMNGWKVVNENYSWESCVAMLERIYNGKDSR